jgi:redoxin
MNKANGKVTKAVEIGMNISIIVVALIGAAVLVKNHLLRSPAAVTSTVQQGVPRNAESAPRSPGARPGPAEGTQLSVAGINWSESSETILLALSNKCHFCTESAPFYQRLTRELAQQKDIRVIAVFPQDATEARKYLDEIGVPNLQVTQATLDSIGVRGTPTLVLVDKTGAVKKSWVGRLSAERESEVISRVKT